MTVIFILKLFHLTVFKIETKKKKTKKKIPNIFQHNEFLQTLFVTVKFGDYLVILSIVYSSSDSIDANCT